MNETESVLGEIRKLSLKFDELSLQVRVDTPWTRLRSHIRYAINVLKEVPMPSRILIFGALILCTVTLFLAVDPKTKGKLFMVAGDMVSLALLFLGS